MHMASDIDPVMCSSSGGPVNASAMEHRWGERVAFDIPVQFLGSARSIHSGRLRNFSVSGSLVETANPPPIMTSIALIIVDAERRLQQPRAFLGYVVRHCHNGFGMSWWNLAPITVSQLLAVSTTHTPGTDMLFPSQLYY